MIRRSTWVLLAVAIVLGAATIYWQRTKQAEPGEPTATPQPELLDFEPGAIQKITIADSGGTQVVYNLNSDGNWMIKGESPQAADTGNVFLKLTQLVSTRILNTLQTTPGEEVTGLATPGHIIDLGLEDGRVIKIEVGAETPTHSGYYLLLNQQDLYVVAKAGIDTVLELLTNPPLATPHPTLTSTGELTPQATTTP